MGLSGFRYQPCVSGDKAYPGIELPRKWMLYVTMTADLDQEKLLQEESDKEIFLQDDGEDSENGMFHFAHRLLRDLSLFSNCF
jgi:hypothetical protein